MSSPKAYICTCGATLLTPRLWPRGMSIWQVLHQQRHEGASISEVDLPITWLTTSWLELE